MTGKQISVQMEYVKTEIKNGEEKIENAKLTKMHHWKENK